MKILEVVTPPSIYHGCSTRKMFWEEKFTGKENLFLAVNMKIVVVAMLGKIRRSRVMTSMSRWISHQSLTVWTIWTSHLQSQKQNRKDQERGWLTFWVSRPKQGPQKYKKARYAIVNVSKKDLSKMIKKFEKIGRVPYVKRIPKHEPTPRYFHLVKSTCEVYDEIWSTQSTRSRQLCGKDCSDIKR